MWFKNVTLFHLSNPFRVSVESLEEKLAKKVSRECGALEMSTLGWGSPIPDGDALTLSLDGAILVAAKKREKILPATVVREALNERIQQIESTEEREVKNREKQRLRDEITVEMLPRAFSRSRTTYAIIDPDNGWLLVDTASRSRAEELTVLLRETLGSLEITNPDTELSPAGAMSQWLFHDTAPAGFTLDDECEIRENDEHGGIIRCKNIDITQGAVRKHLESQSHVVRLAMSWDDRVSFILDQDLTIKRIRPLELIDNMRQETKDEEDAELFFLADMMLFHDEISNLLIRLFELLSTEQA
ncbi:MAG: recombination-associated protein RdgC [Gammaproteobacteria bacterium]|uniref:Recombination-associated protein RdgC n=1 Tax=Candidatus Thiopontia autotrophica TaxID=2841688 RepID=A0A8J6P8R0_9GAMM|nr:recombination-associated protein RdgC [Candidatus Thiopontia autotrophica]MBL6969080.1 recombination-associated protein RdgC [Gammaproteobacteria bacterium]